MLMHLHAETPVHAGGAAADGVVDEPIQRELPSGLPTIWAQSLKGAIKDVLREAGRDDLVQMLGSEPGETPLVPSSVDIVDAMLVALPVPTLHSMFTWATSPLLLSRLDRRLAATGAAGLLPPLPGTTLFPPGDDVFVAPAVDAGPTIQHGPVVQPVAPGTATPAVMARRGSHREDTAKVESPAPPVPEAGRVLAFGGHALRASAQAGVAELASWLANNVAAERGVYHREHLRRHLVLVHDEVLGSLGVECMEVQPRVQLHRDPAQRKTVAQGPFFSEYLPTDTLLSAVLLGPQEILQGIAATVGEMITIGGHATIGRGLMWVRWTGPQDAS